MKSRSWSFSSSWIRTRLFHVHFRSRLAPCALGGPSKPARLASIMTCLDVPGGQRVGSGSGGAKVEGQGSPPSEGGVRSTGSEEEEAPRWPPPPPPPRAKRPPLLEEEEEEEEEDARGMGAPPGNGRARPGPPGRRRARARRGIPSRATGIPLRRASSPPGGSAGRPCRGRRSGRTGRRGRRRCRRRRSRSRSRSRLGGVLLPPAPASPLGPRGPPPPRRGRRGRGIVGRGGGVATGRIGARAGGGPRTTPPTTTTTMIRRAEPRADAEAAAREARAPAREAPERGGRRAERRHDREPGSPRDATGTGERARRSLCDIRSRGPPRRVKLVTKSRGEGAPGRAGHDRLFRESLRSMLEDFLPHQINQR